MLIVFGAEPGTTLYTKLYKDRLLLHRIYIGSKVYFDKQIKRREGGKIENSCIFDVHKKNSPPLDDVKAGTRTPTLLS